MSQTITGNTSSMRKKTLNLRDLFVEPNFDESKSIAVDSKGRLKRLTKEQLDSVRKTGEFEVSVSSLAKIAKIFSLEFLFGTNPTYLPLPTTFHSEYWKCVQIQYHM